MSKLIIAQMPYEQKLLQIAARMEQNHIQDFYVQNLAADALLGNVYVAKVERSAPDLKACFVRISPEQVCFLAWKECTAPIYKTPGRSGVPKAGDELLVQVCREALKEKLPAVTAEICVTGRYLVLSSTGPSTGVSKKLDPEEQSRLKELLSKMREASDYGMIARTAAKDISAEILAKEHQKLRDTLQRIVLQGVCRTVYSCLLHAKSDWQMLLECSQPEELEEIVVEDPAIADEILADNGNLAGIWKDKIRLYKDPKFPLYKMYRFERIVHDATQKKVWMKSGGFLMIEQTEAFVVIDVNSGKSVTGKKAEEAYRKINLEAAAVIAEQLKLRQLSGTILIDFISMKNKEHIDELLHVLRKEVKKDHTKTVVVDVTALQITEMTRQKSRRSLLEEIHL